jgi:hypothetical protein
MWNWTIIICKIVFLPGKLENKKSLRAVLGPLQFIIYINDFPTSIYHIFYVTLFADDTSVLATNDNH